MRSISLNQRNRVISLLESGETIGEVSQKVALSVATVCRIGKQQCAGRKMSKGGRPQALSEADKRYFTMAKQLVAKLPIKLNSLLVFIMQ
jgi:hypothetical protein